MRVSFKLHIKHLLKVKSENAMLIFIKKAKDHVKSIWENIQDSIVGKGARRAQEVFLEGEEKAISTGAYGKRRQAAPASMPAKKGETRRVVRPAGSDGENREERSS